MCWNENVSLNTFIFGIVTIIFIWYNNNYTQYKITEFDNILFYFIIFSYTFMQLIEFFLWKSINNNNNNMNQIFSALGWILGRILQPLMILLIIPKKYKIIKYLLSIIYFSLLIIIYLYKHFYNPVEFKTIIDTNGHLYWKWADLYNYEQILFIFHIIIFLTLFLSYPFLTLFISLFLLYSVFIYKNSFGSMWCWISNSILMYFLIKILFILPYFENKNIC